MLPASCVLRVFAMLCAGTRPLAALCSHQPATYITLLISVSIRLKGFNASALLLVWLIFEYVAQ